MEKVIGPTISVSQSQFTLNGYASDNISGVKKYCFNTSPSAVEYTDIQISHIEQKTYTSSCNSETTYYFHVKDTAGNYKKAQTSVSLYTYSTIYINYYGNGGSGSTTRSSGSVQYYAWGGKSADAYITLRSNGFNYSNHTFLGWDTNQYATSATYSANNGYYFSSTTSMYAIWKSNYAYHCNYCGQDTNSLHYRCPVHYATQSCSTSPSTCSEPGTPCGGAITYEGTPVTAQYTVPLGKVTANYDRHCTLCHATLTDKNGNPYVAFYYFIQRGSAWASCTNSHLLGLDPTVNSCGTVAWCMSHGEYPTCLVADPCRKGVST